MPKNRILSMLILSAILILVLSSVGDFDEVVNQINQEDVIELGGLNNCDPGVAICSVAQLTDKKTVKLSIGFDKPAKNGEIFQINLKLNGIDKQKIRRVEIFFQQGESEAIIERFKYLGGRDEMTSRWLAEANLFMKAEKRENWQAVVKITTLDEKFSGRFLFTLH